MYRGVIHGSCNITAFENTKFWSNVCAGIQWEIEDISLHHYTYTFFPIIWCTPHVIDMSPIKYLVNNKTTVLTLLYVS